MSKGFPSFIPPMLAQRAAAFDSKNYYYEIKWDGIRALIFADRDRCWIKTRRDREISGQYPELNFLAGLPVGTVLDGELVLLKDGLPDFGLLLSRGLARKPLSVQSQSRENPSTYFVFDLLYQNYESIMEWPFSRRRERLEQLMASQLSGSLILSEGVIGKGLELYRQACDHGLEGVVAKKLDSRYLPGKRTRAWLKAKRILRSYGVIFGFVPKGERDFQSLLIAVDIGGTLRYVGRVGTGFTEALRTRLNECLWQRLQSDPVVPCEEKAVWVRPELFCSVRFTELSSLGRMRDPVFEGLADE